VVWDGSGLLSGLISFEWIWLLMYVERLMDKCDKNGRIVSRMVKILDRNITMTTARLS
jgi:hypothetical protein